MSDPITSERLAEIRERDANMSTGRDGELPLRTREHDRRLLLAEVDRLHSWDGLMSLLDEHWPDDIFLTAPDPEDYHEPLYRWAAEKGGGYVRANPGVIITGLIRWVDRLTAERDALREQVERVEALTGGPYADGYRPYAVNIDGEVLLSVGLDDLRAALAGTGAVDR